MDMQLGRRAGSSAAAGIKNIGENLFIVILAFYPLRHVRWGLDLMDTGYNYANFVYMGTEHMDPMWLFSTWLSNVAGHFLTKLPGGGRLVGMNIYTGLFVSLLALAGYFFCTRKLSVRPWVAFLGEMAAISLCWCPTALLYNYMTYVLFMGCFILLYLGLTKDKKEYLIGAGVCLGANVLVRFSNLPEAAMILAVWGYDAIDARERRLVFRDTIGQGTGMRPLVEEGFWKRILRHTGWCLLGYLSALLLLFGCIHIWYGMGEYVKGISRLFRMTETAADYKATAMVANMLRDYTDHLYWVVRMGVFLAGGMLLSMGAGLVKGRWAAAAGKVARAGSIAASIAMVGWLYYRDAEGVRTLFCTFAFYSYDSILRPGILFLMLTMFIAAVRVFHPRSRKEDRLLGGMLILVVLLTSLGSNNRTLPSMNNLFIAAPYTLQACLEFIVRCRDKKIACVTIPAFPVKCVLSAFLLICLFQFGGFGVKFAFAEGTGVQDISARVENNEILKDMGMSEEKAEWMRSISAYVNDNGLQGQEVILYGPARTLSIPALSYYLQMPAAFNPWINLASYSSAAMEEDMRELGQERPVVILENIAALYEEGDREAMAEAVRGYPEEESLYEKLEMILDFMQQNGYVQTFRSEKFAVYQCNME